MMKAFTLDLIISKNSFVFELFCNIEIFTKNMHDFISIAQSFYTFKKVYIVLYLISGIVLKRKAVFEYLYCVFCFEKKYGRLL